MTQRSGRQAAEAAVSPRPSNIPIAGSTMRGWWCSMRATPPIAAPRSAPAPRWSRARREGEHWDDRASKIRAPARSKRSRRGCWSMPPAPGSTTCCRPPSARTTCTMSGWCRAATSSSRKKFDDPRAYFFQNRDGRIIFAIPYEEDFTLIGTTDQDYHGRPARRDDQRRRDRLSLRRGQRIFRASRCAATTSSGPIPPCGRSIDDGASKAQEATRDYVLKADGGGGAAPLAQYLRRQDHHLPPAVGSHAREDRRPARQQGQAAGPPARRCPAAIFRRPVSTPRSRS